MKKISIIIPVYNVKNYIEECLNSLLIGYNYEINNDIEIIVVDDGSTDGSSEICDKFANKYQFIKIIHKKNGGLSSARNAGLKLAKSQWVVFIDSDDLVIPNYLNIILNLVKNQNFDVCMYQFLLFEENSVPKIEKKSYEYTKYKNISKRKAMELLFDGRYTNYAWNKIYDKELFRNIRYPDGLNYEDIITTCRLLNKAKKFGIYDVPLYLYRQRKGSILHTQNISDERKRIYDSFVARQSQLYFFKKNKIEYLVEIANHYIMLDALAYIKISVDNNSINDEFYLEMINFIKEYQISKKYDGRKDIIKIILIKHNYYLFKLLIKINNVFKEIKNNRLFYIHKRDN